MMVLSKAICFQSSISLPKNRPQNVSCSGNASICQRKKCRHLPLTMRTLDLSTSPTQPVSQAVIDAAVSLYTTSNSAINLGRCSHDLGRRATDLLQESRTTVGKHIKAANTSEVIFTPCTSSAMYKIATSLCMTLEPRDEILVAFNCSDETIHHWCHAASRHDLVIRLIRSELSAGSLPGIASFAQSVSSRTRAFVIPLICSLTGVRMPLDEITPFFQGIGVPSILDAAMPAKPTCPLDTSAFNCDIVIADAKTHLNAPHGTVIYGRSSVLEGLPPVTDAEYMFKECTLSAASIDVSKERSNWLPIPERFESGTTCLATAVSIAAAVRASPEKPDAGRSAGRNLAHRLHEQLADCDYLSLYTRVSDAQDALPVATFNVHDCDAGTIASRLAERGVYVAAGTHGAFILHQLGFGVESSVRVIFDIEYHSERDVDDFIKVLNDVVTSLSQAVPVAPL